MASSDFWRDLALQFRKIPNSFALMATLNVDVETGRTHWTLAGEPTSMDEFNALAARGAREVTYQGGISLIDAWLNFLRENEPVFKPADPVIGMKADGSGPRHFLPGMIHEVATHSARLCKKLETRAIQQEFEDKQRDNPENWSPLHRQVEAFQQIKGLLNGPHLNLPESLVRETLAQTLGIKPEEVTLRQITHAVAELLPSYPAITMIPTKPIPPPANENPDYPMRSEIVSAAHSDQTPEDAKSENKPIGVQIDDLRQEARLTVERLAELLDLDRTNVVRHLTDKSKPHLSNLGTYERVFSELLKREVVIQYKPPKRP